MNKECAGCRFLRREEWPKGMTVFRCLKPLPEPFGNGRVVDSPRKTEYADEGRIRRPAWCDE